MGYLSKRLLRQNFFSGVFRAVEIGASVRVISLPGSTCRVGPSGRLSVSACGWCHFLKGPHLEAGPSGRKEGRAEVLLGIIETDAFQFGFGYLVGSPKNRVVLSL